MDLRQSIAHFDQLLQGEQRTSLQESLSKESWGAYEMLLGSQIDDDDEYTLAIVRFVLSLEDPEDFKANLTSDQQAIIASIEETVRRVMGLAHQD